MRLLSLLIIVFMIVSITVILLSVFGFIGFTIYSAFKQVVNQTAAGMNSGINITDYDIMEKVSPMWVFVNIALIIALIFAVVAVFMHTRKR